MLHAWRKCSISVELTNLSVSIDGDKAVAGSVASLKADSLNVNSRKMLELQRAGGRWLITEEVSGN